MNQVQAARRGAPLREALLAAAIIAAVAWVHRREVVAFFGADDLRLLQQAAGMSPPPVAVLRFLSRQFYFDGMLHLFGANPLPFHVAGLLVHLGCVAGLVALARALRLPWHASLLAGILFGCSPLAFASLLQAVTINDSLALVCALAGVLCLLRGNRRASLAGVAFFWISPLLKESVVALPLIAYAVPRVSTGHGRAGTSRIDPWPALAAAVPLIFLVRVGLHRELLQGEAYALGGLGTILSNFLAYTAWATNIFDPLPDLVQDPTQRSLWTMGLYLGVVVLGAIVGKKHRSVMWMGVLWWVLGLAPVLALAHHRYLTYTLVALPGLALVSACALEALVGAVAARGESVLRSGPASRHLVAWSAAVVAVLFALRSDHLIGQRMQLRVPGTTMALDPYTRREETAAVAVSSFGAGVTSQLRQAAVIDPPGNERIVGAVSGQQYRRASSPVAYNLLRAVTDDGRVFRVFFPTIDSVAWTRQWDPGLMDWDLFVVGADGRLFAAGRAPMAHEAIAETLLAQHLDAAARNYLAPIVATPRADPTLRWLYGVALLRNGAMDSAVAQLQLIRAESPQSPLGSEAERVLRTLPRGASNDH